MRNRERKWQTKPLECWAKFKELRAQHYEEVASAKERGKILVTGSAGTPTPVLNGFGGDIVFLAGEGYAGSIGANVSASLEFMAAVEERGYARDMCGYMRNYLGSMFSDRFMFGGGHFPQPDFCYTHNHCDAGHAKWYQIVAEHFGVPLLVVDIPWGPADGRLEQKADWVAAQIGDCIERIERITRREFDDERFLAASRNFFEAERIWGEIVLMNRAIPAPLDIKSVFALMPVSVLMRNRCECVQALKILRDEVKERVSAQIGAAEVERVRLVTDHIPPWSFIQMFRGFQDRGVVFVGIWVYTINGGDVEFRADGTVHPAKTPDELGWPMRTRDDVLRVWGRREMTHPLLHGYSDPHENVRQLLSLYRHWQADGMVLHYNRGCPMQLSYRPEVKLRLENEGIPVTAYESNFSDARDTDGAQIMKRLSAFVDLLDPVTLVC